MTKDKNSKFLPKCLHIDRQLAFVNTGHMTPCCWISVDWNEPYLKDILSKEMHIDNFESIEEILTSEPWIKFFDMLKNNPSDAPPTCKKFCTTFDLSHYIDGEQIFIKPERIKKK
jgi:hypothetical protein